MDEILSASGDRQRLPASVEDIMRQELVNKLEMQMQEEEEAGKIQSDERSATESEDEANRQECDSEESGVCLRISSSCLRRSGRNARWSPIGSPLVRSPTRSPKGSSGRAFLASSAPIGIQQNQLLNKCPELITISSSSSGSDTRPTSPETIRPHSRPTSPRPRRKELYTELDLEAVHSGSMECYSPKRNFLAQTVQF